MTIPVSPPQKTSFSTSPLHSSPLANPPLYFPPRPSSTDIHLPGPIPIPSLREGQVTPSFGPSIPRSPRNDSPSTVSQSQSPSLARSHPLLGSYPLSLLHSRMSHAHAPHSISAESDAGFSIQIRALGRGQRCLPSLRSPPQLVIPFTATCYDLGDTPNTSCSGECVSQTPWVGDVDLEAHYFRAYSLEGFGSALPTPPHYPGYRVSSVGQLQILVRTPTQAVKVFLLPYDLRSLDVGGRYLARERYYVQRSSTSVDFAEYDASPELHESLRYAVQLQFVCLEAPIECRSSCCEPIPFPVTKLTESEFEREYYVSKTIKIIFPASLPEHDEVIRAERTDEVVSPAREYHWRPSRSFPSPSKLSQRFDDWTLVRTRWLTRSETVRGFTPEPLFDVDQLSQPHSRGELVSLPSLLSKLDPRAERDATIPAERGPSDVMAVIPAHPPSPQLPAVCVAASSRRPRRGSLAERELSEHLRSLSVSLS